MSERLIELEIRIAHQEKTIQELSDVVAAQQRTAETFAVQLEKLQQHVRSLDSSPVKDSSDESPPPHY